MTNGPTRRTILLATGAAALPPLLAACGGSDDGGSSEQTVETDETGTGSAQAGGQELTTTDDIPVGGGKIFKDQEVVVTQPEDGEFKAFSSICTHQRCPVASVTDGTINCTCHGSKFSITDGAVMSPPATMPLPEKRITVQGNSIRLV
ncbi:Rieske (2Fe-2S) protein [Streptomyces sp. NPDC000983]|uniref:Rieske (2Fe-2S) protein n=1 Tax=Streptomyces sp. NPDC000983 TaxID=3154373 RepID=UPI00331C106A